MLTLHCLIAYSLLMLLPGVIKIQNLSIPTKDLAISKTPVDSNSWFIWLSKNNLYFLSYWRDPRSIPKYRRRHRSRFDWFFKSVYDTIWILFFSSILIYNLQKHLLSNQESFPETEVAMLDTDALVFCPTQIIILSFSNWSRQWTVRIGPTATVW